MATDVIGWIALGGAAGAAARFLLGRALDRPGGMPYGTALANVLGSALLGLVATLGPGTAVLALVGTGFCGAFTTYSSYALAVALLGTPRESRTAAILLAVTVPVAAVAACALGALVGGALA